MIDKKAEIDYRIKLYTACRGLLRVKLAATTDTTPPTAGATDPNASQTSERMYDAADFGNDLADNIYQHVTGGTSDNMLGQAATAAGGIFMDSLGNMGNAAINSMKNQGGWMGAVGNALDSNTGRSIMSTLGHWGMDEYGKYVKNKNYEAAKKNAKQTASFSPDQMFATMFQNAANSYSQPSNSYFGNTAPATTYY